MAFQITVQGGLDDGDTFRVEGQCIVGRAPRCQILLSDPDVAWEHASLQDLQGRLFLQNLSAAGTKLKGKAVSAETRVIHGDEIEITPSCSLLVEERIGQKSSKSLSPVLIIGLVVLLLAGGITAFNFLRTPPEFIPAIQLHHWTTAKDRLESRMIEWEQRGEFPAEAINIFRDAWRFNMATNYRVAAEKWGILHSVLLTLKLPGSGDQRVTIAEAASPNDRALMVIMDWAQDTSMSMDPQWRTDEAFADALTWFVRMCETFAKEQVEAAQ